MPKTFYTERDIEDLARQGVTALQIDDDIVLTDLGREKARRLGIELVREQDKPPAAPVVRPNIVKQAQPKAANVANSAAQVPAPAASSAPSSSADLHQRVHAAVIARLGDTVDPKLLDTIISRVLQNINTK